MELEYQPTREEQAFLASIMAMPGFKVLLRIGEAESKKFITRLLNTPQSKHEEVLAAHNMAQTAAMLYTGFVNRLNEEIVQYQGAPKPSDKPIDVTEGVLDLGDFSPDDEQLLDYFEER